MICDRKVLMGIGIGVVFTTILIMGFSTSKDISDSEIEERARGFGMHYEDECKVLFEGDE